MLKGWLCFIYINTFILKRRGGGGGPHLHTAPLLNCLLFKQEAGNDTRQCFSWRALPQGAFSATVVGGSGSGFTPKHPETELIVTDAPLD